MNCKKTSDRGATVLPWLLIFLSGPALANDPPADEGSAPEVSEVSLRTPPLQQNLSASIGLHQDVFFGFYPTLAAAYEMAPGFSLTFYSILWTTPAFSFDSAAGGLWTEVGFGVGLSLLDDTLNMYPQVGIVNGTLLSGSARPLFAEGVVPNLTIDVATDRFEAQGYFGYYLAIRGERQNDFIHYWTYAGIKPLGFLGREGLLLSVGAHWEHLRLSRSRAAEAQDIYQWIGPYAQIGLPNKVWLRFGLGWDVVAGNAPNFYKASIGTAF